MDGEASGEVVLKLVGDGVWEAPGARIIDRAGLKRLPIGQDGFVPAMWGSVLVDKTMLIADVLDSGYTATLFCRPRRFGKTLNITMLQAFLEAPEAGGLPRDEAERLFAGTEVWEAEGGRWRPFMGAYPVVHLSLNTLKKLTWADSLAGLRMLMAAEYLRHAYLRETGSPLLPENIAFFDSVAGNAASDADFAGSLSVLCRLLKAYHGRDVVVLIDEYDAPVMAGYTNGYYKEAVSFLKGWLTGALKDGGAALAFACLTGVQRISKESVFSDLNNLFVSTPLSVDFGERYGFTDAEVHALATYMGHGGCMTEAREWYDGYRFGKSDVYNPWSVLNYLRQGCSPDVYWGNTSGNAVVGELVAGADPDTLGEVYSLLEPGGVIEEPLDLGVVFPEIGARAGALWSMLYLSGYLTTDDTEMPNDDTRLRALRIPDREVAHLFRSEVVKRFRAQAGGVGRLASLHRALLGGDAPAFSDELSSIARRASSFDLTGELPCHMLVMGLLFGVEGYEDPLSNREAGSGRYDIRLEPCREVACGAERRPLVTVELKFLKPTDSPADPGAASARLLSLARGALAQIGERGYDVDVPPCAVGRLRWGVAFCGKRVEAVCERVS